MDGTATILAFGISGFVYMFCYYRSVFHRLLFSPIPFGCQKYPWILASLLMDYRVSER